MMRFGFSIMVGIAMTCCGGEAKADFYSGNEIYAKCSVSKSDSTYYQSSAYCMAYIAGVLDTMILWQASNKARDCLPSGITVGQMRDVVVKYLAAHPENRQILASTLTILAMQDAYGCTFKPAPAG